MPKKRRNADVTYAILIFLSFGLIKLIENDIEFWWEPTQNIYDGKSKIIVI